MTAPGDPDPAEPDDVAESDVAESRVPLLTEPADGVPEPVMTASALAQLVDSVRSGSGPVALDAERASGYRYSQRAYLVQLRRAGVGSALIDPIEVPDLSALDTAIGDAEWILHAASQDLACLAEVGMTPRRLFDTELAGRLLGSERVALGTMVEQYLGVRLEKGYSAADWSTRPLPREWLVYAALDVELLIALRDVLTAELLSAGKLGWAEQEFEAIRAAAQQPLVPRADPWRRTSGIHRVRNRRQLAAVRALWQARDEYAAERDIAPGRVLPDSSIIEAARVGPRRMADLAAIGTFGGGRQRRQLGRWFAALEAASQLSDDELPTVNAAGGDGIPPAGRWRDRDPEAAERLLRCRDAVTSLATEHQVVVQNLLASDVVRRLAWQPPEPLDVTAVATRLDELGARPWQVELCAAALLDALIATAAE